jgi:hypothetical protein
MEFILKKLLVVAAVSLCLFPVIDANAASKKKTSRSNFSKAQQAKFFNEALKICRKDYGGSLHHVEVNYAKHQYICYHY